MVDLIGLIIDSFTEYDYIDSDLGKNLGLRKDTIAGITWYVITNHIEITVVEIKRFVDGEPLYYRFNM